MIRENRGSRSEYSIVSIDIEPELRESAADIEIKIFITRERQRAQQNGDSKPKHLVVPKNPQKSAPKSPAMQEKRTQPCMGMATR